MVPDYDELRSELMQQLHATPWAGHLGKRKTLDLIKRKYWWPQMEADIERFVQTCPSCQRNRSLEGGKSAAGRAAATPSCP